MRREALAGCAGLLLAAVMLTAALTAPVASAHAARVSAEPADNATVATGPQRVSATFNERLQTTFAAMTVVGPDGNVWSTGDPTVQGAVVGVGLRPLGPAGTYTVNYRVTSADGHVVSGSWSFRLTVPGTGTPGPAATGARPGGHPPVWPFAVATLALVAAAGAWAARRRR
ncbi:copper resistance CopC family protein [Mycobacterium palustre]|uniref:Copper resistance protein CopC n=1 Tax=Mycobacterium palustre TaxID=153971 RepID=A0A1X2A1P7_9MYCO|nr:copper resistance CopC family protein [Mycobacterium palustre]ORW34825.1 copper resistance protein CopC [Mycobacterium palustre]ORW34841.1 copper resistance protein CopC [Mycobacterium palustre]